MQFGGMGWCGGGGGGGLSEGTNHDIILLQTKTLLSPPFQNSLVVLKSINAVSFPPHKQANKHRKQKIIILPVFLVLVVTVFVLS